MVQVINPNPRITGGFRPPVILTVRHRRYFVRMRSYSSLSCCWSYSSLMAILLSALVVSGCASPKVRMYQGVEVEANRQAIIRGDEHTSGGGIIGIVSVDGETTTDFFTYGFHGGKWAGEVSVLPGKHSIIARIEYPFSHAMAYLWLVAEAGESYVIKARSEGLESGCG